MPWGPRGNLMIRSVLAFVVGFLMIAVAGALLDAVSDPYRRAAPTVGVVVALLYFAPSIAGGYLAALIGRRRPVTHAAAVAAFIGITGVIYLIVEVPKELVWFELLKFGVVVP